MMPMYRCTRLGVLSKNWLRSMFTALIAPQQCILCGKISGSVPICTQCVAELFVPYLEQYDAEQCGNNYSSYDARRCSLCGTILISEQNYCTRCTMLLQEGHTPCFCDKTFTLFPYIGLGQEIVPRWKNNSMRNFAAVFAPLVYAFLQKQPQLSTIPLVPVPPRPQKIRQKGWDQIEDIAHYLAVFPEITVCRCLKRHDGIAQKQLSREQRLHNLRGKIQMCSAKPVPEAVIILDDVRTTGSTLETCAAVLKENGCKKVYALCLFFD
ncbi:MAG: ComF family protein [Treponema sp.]